MFLMPCISPFKCFNMPIYKDGILGPVLIELIVFAFLLWMVLIISQSLSKLSFMKCAKNIMLFADYLLTCHLAAYLVGSLCAIFMHSFHMETSLEQEDKMCSC